MQALQLSKHKMEKKVSWIKCWRRIKTVAIHIAIPPPQKHPSAKVAVSYLPFTPSFSLSINPQSFIPSSTLSSVMSTSYSAPAKGWLASHVHVSSVMEVILHSISPSASSVPIRTREVSTSPICEVGIVNFNSGRFGPYPASMIADLTVSPGVIDAISECNDGIKCPECNTSWRVPDVSKRGSTWLFVGSNRCNVNVTMSPALGLRDNDFGISDRLLIEFSIFGVALHSSPLARNNEEVLCMDPTSKGHEWILEVADVSHAVAMQRLRNDTVYEIHFMVAVGLASISQRPCLF